MKAHEPCKVVYDFATGEKLTELYEGDRILRKQTAEYLADTVELLPNETYVRLYSRPMFELAKTLTGAEMQFVYYLLSYLSYESGMLRQKNGKPLDRDRMCRDTGLSARSVDRMLASLKEKQVIGRNVTGREVQYFMNPYLFMRGKRVNKTLHAMFCRTRWAMLYKGGV